MTEFTDDTVVALAPLLVNGIRAANRGDVVPAENVEANGWGGQVAAHGTTDAIEALGYDPYNETATFAQGVFELEKASVEEVLAHVGADHERAAQVIEQELARPKPRTTLLEKLTPIANLAP